MRNSASPYLLKFMQVESAQNDFWRAARGVAAPIRARAAPARSRSGKTRRARSPGAATETALARVGRSVQTGTTSAAGGVAFATARDGQHEHDCEGNDPHEHGQRCSTIAVERLLSASTMKFRVLSAI